MAHEDDYVVAVHMNSPEIRLGVTIGEGETTLAVLGFSSAEARKLAQELTDAANILDARANVPVVAPETGAPYR